MSAGKLFKQARERSGLTQVKLAGIISVDPSSISRWERDETVPEPEHLKAAAKAMKCSEADLVFVPGRKRHSLPPSAA